ncbi:DUF4912 domain-containing protein [Blastopirellula sp. J2-11]|uniref:DUF4912 domain-containing protein n=1 Tax=Blastopirellula sp. J2-11 TaxID=2943192 RepID=UPI0021C64863|nr:DUF4912 domain-containing protein [Blastopirellula sp. J2-11]
MWRTSLLITAASLKEYTAKDLAQMAKSRGVSGWHSMRKDELVKAILKLNRTPVSRKAAATKATNTAQKSTKSDAAPAKRSRTAAPPKSASAKNGAARVEKSNPKVVRNIQNAHERREQLKDISHVDGDGAKDRIALMVRDSYWLHAYWEISRKSIQRAKAALAEHWHTARPVLRLMEVDGGAAERVVRQIEVHGGVRNWYIDVNEPPKSFRAVIGYVSASGKFHALSRSNMVTTPEPGACDDVDANWSDVAENVDRIYALSGGNDDENVSRELKEMLEERFSRPIGEPLGAQLGKVAERLHRQRPEFELDVDVEMIVYGRTRTGAYVTLSGDPVKVHEDGAFLVKMNLPDKRQIFPIVARSHDGLEQRTVALAIERNTKIMDPVSHDSSD